MKAFTLVEILIASAIMITVVSSAFLIFSHLTQSSTREARQQELYGLMARLEARVKQDLRSSEGITEEAEGVYSLKVVNLDPSGNLQTKTIVYWVDESGLGVTRHVHETGKKTIYNFAALKDNEKPFIFKLKP